MKEFDPAAKRCSTAAGNVSASFKRHMKSSILRKSNSQFHENLLVSDRQMERVKHWTMKAVQVTGQKQDFSDCIVSKQAELSSKKSMSVTDSGQGRGRTELKHCEVPSDPAVSQHTGQKTTKMKLETLKTNQ